MTLPHFNHVDVFSPSVTDCDYFLCKEALAEAWKPQHAFNVLGLDSLDNWASASSFLLLGVCFRLEEFI